MAGVILGEIDLPDGILVILDPGLGRFWRHDGDPRSPRRSDPDEHDLAIVGDDAEAAGRAYDREFDPRFLFDRRDPAEARAQFEAFAAERGLRAHAEVLGERVAHTARLSSALVAGRGLGVVRYNGLWAVVADGLPADRSLPVEAVELDDGEFAGRLAHVDVIVADDAEVATIEHVTGVMVEHGQLLFAGVAPLGDFRMWESRDGLADYVFWGRDAGQLAAELGADDLGRGDFGWRDLPMDEVADKAGPLQHRVVEAGLTVAIDYRPHCNLERLNAQMRARPDDAAQIELAGSRVVACGTRWGDGVYRVSRHLDGAGRLLRIRVELGDDERQRLARQVAAHALGAIVTRSIARDREPIRFAERYPPANGRDSGWCFASGVEDDDAMDALSVVSIESLLRTCPELDDVLGAPVGARYRRDGARFVLDDGEQPVDSLDED